MLKALALLLSLQLAVADFVAVVPSEFQAEDGLLLDSDTVVLIDSGAQLVGVADGGAWQQAGQLGWEQPDGADWPGSLGAFDDQPGSLWGSWLDRQFDMLDAIQSAVFGPPCGMAAAGGMAPDDADFSAAAASQALLTRMAASRFGPALLDVYNTQMAAEDGGAEGMVVTSVSAGGVATLQVAQAGGAGWAVLSQSFAGDAGPNGFGASWLQALVLPGGDYGYAAPYDEEADYDLAAPAGTAFVPFSSLRPLAFLDYGDDIIDPAAADWAGPEDGPGAGPGAGADPRPPAPPPAGADWGLLLFVWLSAACAVVWAMLARSYLALTRLAAPACPAKAWKAEWAKAAHSAQAPLLVPLEHENPLLAGQAAAAAAAAAGVQVAAEHVDSQQQYVTIHYVPLQSEPEAHP